MKPPEILSRFAEARALLAGPLKFGDPELLTAVALIESAKALAEKLKTCNHEFHETETCDDGQECDGEVEIKVPCACLRHPPKIGGVGPLFDEDLVEEAFRIAGIEMPEFLR